MIKLLKRFNKQLGGRENQHHRELRKALLEFVSSAEQTSGGVASANEARR